MSLYDEGGIVSKAYKNITKWSFIIGGSLIFLRLFGPPLDIPVPNWFFVVGLILLAIGSYFKFFIKKQ